jgi:hypothetical protein
MKSIWEEYYDRRDGVKPKTCRTFSLPRVLSLIQEIYDERWNYEELHANDDEEEVLKTFRVSQCL